MHYGEELCLCVQMKQGAEFNAPALREFVRSRLAEFKVPKYIIELESFPLSTTGKVLTAQLKEMVLSRLGLSA